MREILGIMVPRASGPQPACRIGKLFVEGFNRCRFVVLDVEDGIELGDL